jgi:hypothetical protein
LWVLARILVQHWAQELLKLSSLWSSYHLLAVAFFVCASLAAQARRRAPDWAQRFELQEAASPLSQLE